jgi:hypothetical protein
MTDFHRDQAKKKILKTKINLFLKDHTMQFQNGRFSKWSVIKIANSQIFFCENFMDWSLG